MVVAGAYLYWFGEQTYQARKIPAAWETPVPLPNLSISPTVHREPSFCGYEFELPWDDVDGQKSRTTGSIQLTAFRSKNAFWSSCFPPKSFVSEVMKDTKADSGTFQRLYGNAAFGSDYDFYRAILAVTPRTISLFTPNQEVRRDARLLLIKAIALPETDSGIFLVQTPRA